MAILGIDPGQAGNVMLSVVLPIELTNGNDGRTKHFGQSAQRRKMYVRRLCNLKKVPFDVPVNVVVTRILGKNQRLWDYSSGLRGNWKEIEDALVELGWFVDDGPKWIKGVYFRQDVSRRPLGPSTRVEVLAHKRSKA